MQKIVINQCYGGFGLSDEAVNLYAKLAGINLVSEIDEYGFTNFYRDSVSDGDYFSYRDIKRDDPHLVEAVERLGSAAWGKYAKLKVVEVPDYVEWYFEEYDGLEWVSEKHRTWG